MTRYNRVVDITSPLFKNETFFPGCCTSGIERMPGA